MSTREAATRRRGRVWPAAAVLLLVAGAHAWTIWMAPHALSFSVRHVHTDNAVMPLMGKHMLEKGEFPIFYYGQDWFGSLSAMVHAAVFLVLGGIPPWSIHVAPLLFFLGFCVLQYLLARATLGPAVAVCALAWNLVTPVYLSEYATMPHGGYVESLMLGTALLWLAVRLVLAEGTWRKNGYYGLLGLVGGLAWWTSPLVVYHALAAAAYVVLRERTAAVVKGVLLSLPAFLVGAGPFFYFYAVDPYSSLSSLGGGYAVSHVPEGLRIFLLERLPDYLDWPLFPSAVPHTDALAAIVYGGSTLALLWSLRGSLGPRHPRRDAAIFPIFLLVFVLLFVASAHIRRHAPQYALPLSTFFPVALAFAVVHAPRRWRPAAWAAGAALFVLHGWTTASWVAREAPRAEALTRHYRELVAGLEARGVTHVYTPAPPGSELLNFYARERVIASQPTAERYPPNLEALERDPEPAFLVRRSTDGLTPTLRVLGASYETEEVAGYAVIRRARPRDRRYRQVPAPLLRGSASHGAEAAARTADRDMDSAWTGAPAKTPGMWVQLDLGRPFSVGQVRLWNRGQDHGSYSMQLRVEVSADGRTWIETVPRSATDHYYGSGPRIYPWEWGYRWEARFAPTLARFVRITQYEDDGRFPWRIAEAYVYEDLGPRAPGDADERDVLRRIEVLGLTRVYADRWMSARIADASRGRIDTVVPFTIAIEAFYVRLGSRLVRWDAGTGFVLDEGDADEFERMIRDEGVHHLARESFGRWVLFRVTPAAAAGALPADPGWWWTGLGVVRIDARGKSRYLASLGRAAYAGGRMERALALSRRAVDGQPCSPDARRLTIEALRALGRQGEAAAESRALAEGCEPRVRTPAEFRGALELLGYTPDRERARPGEDVTVRYFWRVKRDPGELRGIAVFVHVEGHERRFQGDYRLVEREDEGGGRLSEGDVVIREARIRVPEGTPPGTYRMLLGVYDLATGKRWSAAAGDPRHDRVPLGALEVATGATP